MKVDADASEFQEADTAKREFNRVELRRCRTLLRRLRFLETQIRARGQVVVTGSDFVRWEAEALAWALTDLGFLQERKQA